jgi:5-methylcytosine-specific restriction endonuclease McrA
VETGRGWTIGVLGLDSRRGLGIFLFTTSSRTALGPTQPPIQWVPGALSLGVKRPGREADHSPPSSAEVKECVELYLHSPNTPSWRGAQLKKHRDNFTYTFYLYFRRCEVWLWNSRNDFIASIPLCLRIAEGGGLSSKYSPWAAMHVAQRCCHCRKHFWNSCCRIAVSAVVTFFLSVSSFFWNLRPFEADCFWKQPELTRSQLKRIGWVFDFSNWFLGQKLLDRERLVSWSIVVVENVIIGPKFMPFYMYATVSVSKFSCTTIAPILKHLSECTRFHTFQHFHRFSEFLDDLIFHHLPLSLDPLWTVYATQRTLDFFIVSTS